MNEREVGKLLDTLRDAQHKVNPDPAWVTSNRNRLMAHIARTTEAVPQRVFTLNHIWAGLSLLMPQRTVYAVVRPVAVFVACFVAGTAGWITTVSASLNSIPGDTLYPVKIATEKTQVAVVEALQGQAASTELRLSFVSRRVEEVNKIHEAPIAPEEKRVRTQRAVEQFQSDVKVVAENLATVQVTEPEAAVAVAKAIDRKAEEIKITLSTNTDVSATETVSGAVSAIAQLQEEAGRVTSVAVTTSTPTVAATTSTVSIMMTSTIPVVLPGAPSSTVTSTMGQTASTTQPVPSIIIRPQPVRAPKPATTSAEPVLTEEQFPDRPKELAPDVVDGNTQVSIEIWVDAGHAAPPPTQIDGQQP